MNQYIRVGDVFIGIATQNDSPVYFLIDADDYAEASKYRWFVAAKNYMSAHVTHDGSRKQFYLHNLVMRRYGFYGKGQRETVDHINRIGFDNRKCNLRIATQSEQNINQGRRPRHFTLPEGCGLTHEDIPRHIWYVKANGLHGDRFAIEFKTKGLVWRTTSSKTVPLREKLEDAKEKLRELYSLYPELDPQNPDRISQVESLADSFHAIVALASS